MNREVKQKRPPRIVLLGNNSGRNLGDAAILSSILESLSNELPDAEFIVPSIFPGWIKKHYGKRYNVKPVNVMPWTVSLRLLGIPTLYHLARSDLALICDGIIFGKKLLNPAFNYLITLIFLVPWAKLWGCKVVCYSCGIGPFPSRLSRICARYVIQNSDLVSMRERDSLKLAKELGVTKKMELTGDAAFINPVSDRKRALEILSENGVKDRAPYFGINVTRYVDAWLSPDERVADKSAFLDMIAKGVNTFIRGSKERITPLIFSTQPMDEDFCKMLAGKTGAAVIDNSRYLSHDIQSVMRECELLIGMRFHSLVLASAVEVPVIGLVYAPKVRGFMRLLDCERYSLELKSLSPEKLGETLLSAWNERKNLKNKQKKVIDQLKDGARRAATLLKRKYFPEYATNTRQSGETLQTSNG